MSSPGHSAVHSVPNLKQFSASQPAIHKFRGMQMGKFTCYGCGRRGHTQASNDCPAKQTKCAICGKVGHWAKRCYSSGQAFKRRAASPSPVPNPKRVRAISDESDNRNVEDYVFYAMGRNEFVFKVGGVEIPMTIDSGSDANIITKSVWIEMKEAKVSVEEMSTDIDRTLLAYASNEPMHIVGDQTAKDLRVLKVGLNIGSVEVKQVKPFPKIRDVVVEIPIDPDVQPVQQPYRRPPIAMEEKIEETLRSLLERDIIEPAPGPSPWVSPLVPVLKDSDKIRLCIDMRRANQAVLRETHPLPLVEELLGSVTGAVRFSKIDIKDAYHQVEISERSRPITTFITKYGLFRYKRLMFGVSCAPEFFQKVMESILAGLDGLIVYLDDVIIHGTTKKEHDE
ncbi:uncharacterized protein K02A2.6-like, partial [Armigeres subalbatus]|uniref:uncharacterized protein K02A2.6-like n=1 Tax=Armigeres subalbatus TaxID=124917 RepID=UPI002ED3C34F